MTIKHTYYKRLFLLFAMAFSFTVVNAQYASQEELKSAADKFFVEEDYVQALPLFSQLLSLYPKDPNYNFKYGACYLFANREKEDALKYLKFAVSKPNVNPQAFYFMGLAYQHEYQFSAAELNFNKFREKGSPKDVQYFQVDRKIEMCKNGATLLKSMTDIGVLSKKEIKQSEFFRSYDLRGIGGKIIVKPDEFKTKLDLKKNETSIIHLGENPTMVVFSSYGNDEKNGKDIYKVVKLPNGDWSKPTPFQKINTKYDEDYPFLHPDGKTLYFSSKGYNSMGGYDIFKSTLDPLTGEWSYPENLDFPINTPDDDILFISDIDNQLAYFASSRASIKGELTVYKVQVDRQPAENTVVKGIFIAENNPSMKSATISIVDAEKDRKYGVFNTNRDNGEYLLVFPGNGGKFKILVETTNDSPIHSAIIELPKLDGFRALKQELRLVGEGDNQKLVVKNLFNESDEFDITDPLIVENLLKNKAKMEVNMTENDALANLENVNSAEQEVTNSYTNLSNQELVTNAQKNASTIVSNAQLSKNQANFTYNLAAKKSAEAKDLYNKSEQQFKLAKESQELSVKTRSFIEGEKLKQQAANLVNEAVAALNLAKTIESESVERQSDVDVVNQLSASISSKINSGNRNDAEQSYAKLDEISNATYNQKSAVNSEQELINDKLDAKESDYNKARNNVIELTNHQTELTEQINNLSDRINKTNKKSEKDAYQAEIDAFKIDLEDVKYDLGVAKDKETQLAKELNETKNIASTSTGIIEDVKKANIQSPIKQVDKVALSNDIAYFEKQGLVGLYPSEENIATTTTASTYNLKDHKNEYSIITEEGKIADYNTPYSSQLVDAENNQDEYQRSLEKAKINQDWIASINQELEIKSNQLKATDNLNEKTKIKSRIEVLTNLKAEKQKEADNQLAMAQLLNNSSITATNKQPINNVKSNSTSQQNTSVNISDAQGNIMDYASGFENQLTALDAKESSPSTTKEKIAVYEQWKNANEQELLLKKIELKSAEGEDKIAIVNRIEELDNQIANNKEYIALYNEKISSSEQPIAINETNNSTESTASNTTQPIDYTKYNKNVVNQNGEVLDYTSDFKSQLDKTDNIVDPSIATKEKQQITSQWISAIDEEINYRNDQLSIANPTEKPSINSQINNLKNEKASLNEQLTNYNLELNKQQSTLAITNNQQSTSSVATTNSSSTNNVNTPYTYSSPLAQQEIAQVNQLQNEVEDLNNKVEEKTTLAYATKDETKRQDLLNEADVLKTASEDKQLEIANTLEKSNKTEFYSNQEIMSKVRLSSNTNDKVILAELNEDESNKYYEQAKKEREKAANAESFSSKQSANQKAEELEITALEKQRKAIEVFKSENSQPLAVVNNTNENSATGNNTIINKQQPASTQETPVTNKQNLTSIQPVPNSTVYIPLKVYMPSDNELLAAKSKENEAKRLEKEAIILQDSAQKVTKLADKDVLTKAVNDKSLKASQLRKDAEVNYATANKLAVNEATTVTQLNANRNALNNEKFSDDDQKIISELSSTEIAEISKSPEYTAYASLKNDSRRLIKDAEVNYINADKIQEEAEDQKTLEVSLNAMSAGATGPSKTKLLGQIEKLKVMIQDNETKSAESRKIATDKELEALDKSTKASNMLASNPGAEKIKAIEKAEVYNKPYLDNVLAENKTVEVKQPNSFMEEEPVVDKQEPITEQQQPVVDKQEPITEQQQSVMEKQELVLDKQEPIAEHQQPVLDKLEPVVDKQEPIAEHQQPVLDKLEPVVDKQEPIVTTNNAKSNVDVIPTVLTNQIFEFTPNKTAAYSDSKKIPVSPKLPEGLVFKVQIGAFRNPIPQDHFRGFAPIMAEDAGGGITRYTAGLFKTFNMANEAKNAIRTIGYPDAFVVGFYNGKRISVNEARAMMNGGTEPSENVVNNNTSNKTEVKSTAVTIEPKNNTSPKLPEPKATYEEVKDGISTDVNKIKGVFFTVQVGVYSRPITAEQLNNVTPLNSEKTSSGLYKYTSGVYQSLNDANAAKDRIIALGITDAFIIAYANGNKVSMNEAVEFISAGNTTSNIPASTSNNKSTTPINSTPEKQPTTNNISNQTSNNQPLNTSENNTTIKQPETTNTTVNNTEAIFNTTTEPSLPKKVVNQVDVGQKLKLEFKVLLGKYTEEVPVDEATVYLKFSNSGIEIKESNGKMVYTMGSYPDYPSALDLQIQMKVEGIKNPKVIALKNGTSIEVNDALELVKNYNE